MISRIVAEIALLIVFLSANVVVSYFISDGLARIAAMCLFGAIGGGTFLSPLYHKVFGWR